MNDQTGGDSSKSGADSFSARHRALLVVLGATLILTTFVVRDYYLEKRRGERDDASGQRTTLQLRGDIFALKLAIGDLNSRTLDQTAQEYVRLIPLNPQSANDYLAFTGALILDGAAQIVDERNYIAAIVEVIGKSDGSKINALLNAEKTYEGETSEAAADLVKSVATERPRALTLVKNYQMDCLERRHDFDHEILTTEREIVKEREDLEEEAQRKYDFAAHLSYVVFAIGWIVVLLGRLKGISLSAD